MKRAKMQKENLIKKEEKTHRLDLDTKKEFAKIGMAASLGVTVATSFYMKSKFMKNLHVIAGTSLVAFSLWHHLLYQPEKKEKKEKTLKTSE